MPSPNSSAARPSWARTSSSSSTSPAAVIKMCRKPPPGWSCDLYRLDQQISALERDFVQEGGYSEQLAAARIAERRKQDQREGTVPANKAPNCPLCGKPMALRTARKGPSAGSQFWGCTGYPGCKGTR